MFHRRELLQVGCSSFFGLGLTSILHQQVSATAKQGRAKSVELIFLTGGGSHIDMFDPKPEASEIKGEFEPTEGSFAAQYSTIVWPMPALLKYNDVFQIDLVRAARLVVPLSDNCR